MQFGLFYQQQLPKPWVEGREVESFAENLAQVELADQLGFHSVWVTEHHFLEEYSHSSAPEVFLGAVAARTKNIRLGHGIRHTVPQINIPARVAEGVATLDIISNGRVDFGFGEGATRLELNAHFVDPRRKREMAVGAAEQIANMMVMTPYPGWDGEHFRMEARNVVPKPVQKPHPPLWMACTNRETIKLAARLGVGALAFTFLDPHECEQWVSAYYDIIKSEECVPIGHSVNAQVAMVSALSIDDDRARAVREGYDCFNFFKYAITATILEDSRPGHTNLWGQYEARERLGGGKEAAAKKAVADGDEYSGAEGTPADVSRRLRIFRDAGVDQLLFTIQGGHRSNESVCNTLNRFAEEVMSEFADEHAALRAERDRELAPFIAAALERKQYLPALSYDDIPIVRAVDATKVKLNAGKNF